jgi:transcriptional regulator with XRE-family HTH domain
VNRLREYRQRYGWTQAEVVAEIHRRALERGDPVAPGLDQTAVSRHENGHKRPCPRNRALYAELYGADAVELGFRVDLPAADSNDDDVDRREFLTGAAGLAASAALPTPRRLGNADLMRLRESAEHLYRLDDLHGSGAVSTMTSRTFHRLRGLVERASYGPATGNALRELTGQTAEMAGWLAFDAGQHDEARRWWLEAMHWARLADSDAVSIVTMASMANQASDSRHPREAIDLAQAAQRTAGRAAAPRLTSVLLAREAVGHARAGDAASTHAALRRARSFADQSPGDDDPGWLAFYGPADFAGHERRAALALGDTLAAEDAARAALALNDPVAYPRNHALYLVRLADVLARRREVDESAAIATRAAVAAADIDSGRVKRGLRAVAQRLGPYRGDAGVDGFLALV